MFSTSAGEAPFEEQPFPIDKEGLLFFSMRFTGSFRSKIDQIRLGPSSFPSEDRNFFDKEGSTKVIGSQ